MPFILIPIHHQKNILWNSPFPKNTQSWGQKLYFFSGEIMYVSIRSFTWGGKCRIKPISLRTKLHFLANYALHWYEVLGRTVPVGSKFNKRSFFYQFPQKYSISFRFFIHWLQRLLWQLVLAKYTVTLEVQTQEFVKTFSFYKTLSNSNSRNKI